MVRVADGHVRNCFLFIDSHFREKKIMISWKLVKVTAERDVTTIKLGPEPVIVGREMVRDLGFRSFVIIKICYLLRFKI